MSKKANMIGLNGDVAVDSLALIVSAGLVNHHRRASTVVGTKNNGMT